MSNPTTSTTNNDNDDDKKKIKSNDDDVWAQTADLYSHQAARLTELHATDLILLLQSDLRKAQHVLEVGCGTGAFLKAYLQIFPHGIPGQTLYLTDLSPSMLTKAKEQIVIPPNYATCVKFQQEDGTKLDGISNNSMDMVISLFGIFLIPNQESTLAAVKRVLSPHKNNVFANASWVFDESTQLFTANLGVSLQDAFKVPTQIMDPQHWEKHDSFQKWSSAEEITSHLRNHGFAGVTDSNNKIHIHRAIHTTVWDLEIMWTMMQQNPMSNLKGASPEQLGHAKQALMDFVHYNNAESAQPLMLSTISNLCIARNIQ